MFKPLLPYLEYALNYEQISTELCENKDEPKMNCHGKCYLKKQVKKAAKEEQKPFVPNFENITEDVYVYTPRCCKSVIISKISVETVWANLDSGPASGYTQDVWTPPKGIVLV